MKGGIKESNMNKMMKKIGFISVPDDNHEQEKGGH